MNAPLAGRLALLARLYGAQTSFLDVFGQRRRPPPEALLAVLRSLGAPVAGPADVEDAVRHRRLQRWRRLCEPVIPIWRGEESGTILRLRAGEMETGVWVEVAYEGGGVGRWRLVPPGSGGGADRIPARPVGSFGSEGGRFEAFSLTLPFMPLGGYHELRIEAAGRAERALLLAAPSGGGSRRSDRETAPVPTSAGPAGGWGLFAPLYALAGPGGRAIGDLGDLRNLVDFVADRGGRFAATLPFLSSAHWLEPDRAGREYSPYNPASRLFWDERYLDLSALEGTGHTPVAMHAGPGAADAGRGGDLASQYYVDHGAAMAFRRAVLDPLAERFFSNERLPEDFHAWLAGHPHVGRYARFAAAQESLGLPWSAWPRELLEAEGDLIPLTGDERDRPDGRKRRERLHRYHLFVQWCLERQVVDLFAYCRNRNTDLMLDLPLGVPPHAYDTWAYKEQFAFDAAVGAPPDTFFRAGQNWGFAPPVPERCRREGHDYFIEVVRHHVRHARMLRIDHIMGLFRQYWIPEGFDAEEGVYVRGPVEEHFAVLALEAERAGALLVGEDLGTVPRVVRSRMRRYGAWGMYVVQSAFADGEQSDGSRPHAWQAAMINTHDMPLFAAWWADEDVVALVELGHLSQQQAEQIRGGREAGRARLLAVLGGAGLLEEGEVGAVEIHAACLRWLASSDARLMLVNLEDLWGEKHPQNVPGTGPELPNWRRRTRFTLQEAAGMPGVDGVLRGLQPAPEREV